jgi:hypothetical protein
MMHPTRLRNLAATIFASTFLFTLSGCMTMRPGPASYSSYSDDPGDLEVRLAEKRNDTALQMGLSPYENLSRSDRQRVNDRMELEIAERRLDSERDKEMYFRVKPEFASDRDRIKFLRLDSLEARQSFLQSHKLLATPDRFNATDAHLIVDQDIAVGMTKRAVRASWGDADSVEVAGNPRYGNEKWNYTQTVPSASGFKTFKRTIVFEGGQVVGWQSRN